MGTGSQSRLHRGLSDERRVEPPHGTFSLRHASIALEASSQRERWESGEMALRWSAAGMLVAQAQFRRVQGYRELPMLAAALKRELNIESTAIATN